MKVMRRGVWVVTLAATAVFGQANEQHGVLSADNGIPCEAARSRVASEKGLEPAEFDVLQARLSQCNTDQWNKAHPEDPMISLGVYDAEKKTVVFGAIHIKDAKALRAGCQVAASVITASEFSGDPLLMTLSGVVGEYSCESYFQAAVASDPMLLVLPVFIPSKRLTTDVWREVRRSTEKLENRSIGGLVPGTRIPIFVVSPHVAAAVAASAPLENIRREAEKAVENLKKETGKAMSQPATEVGRGAGNVLKEGDKLRKNLGLGK